MSKGERESLLKEQKLNERKKLEKEAVAAFLMDKVREIESKKLEASAAQPKRSAFLASVNRARNATSIDLDGHLFAGENPSAGNIYDFTHG